MEIRKLRADEIDCRVSQIASNWLTILLYKDARVDMNILDECVGSMNWKKEYKRDNANCVVSIWDEDKKEWVSKEDTGTESFSEAEKGLASDSFKRACFNWGIGRELYTAPTIFISPRSDMIPKNKKEEFYEKGNGKYETKTRFYVDYIDYDDKGNIVDLVIKDNKGNVRFEQLLKEDTKPKKATKKTAKTEKKENKEESEDKLAALFNMHNTELETNSSHEKILEYFGVKSDRDMTIEQINQAINMMRGVK